ncbi:MAG: FxsA family protein [Myxococcota bacterium]|nr:FxsA family protein [Myxococcota bacterium]
MFWKLLLAMTIIPSVELYLLLRLGQWLGAMETVMLIIATGAVGATLAKREGLGVLAALQNDARSGLPPAGRLVEGLMVLTGGVLLLTPGVVTDLLGLALIAPVTRRPLAPLLQRWLGARARVGGFSMGAARWGPGVDQTVTPAAPPGADDADPAPRFEHPES